MTAVPFPVSSSPGTRAQEGAGRLINCHVVKTEQGAPTPLKWTRSPGLAQLATAAHNGFRGFVEYNGSIIAVLANRVELLAKSGAVYSFADLGTLSGAKLVTVAKNNASPANVACVTENGAFNLFANSIPTDWADADLPQPNSVSGVKGYLAFTIADGRLFASTASPTPKRTASLARHDRLSLGHAPKTRAPPMAACAPGCGASWRCPRRRTRPGRTCWTSSTTFRARWPSGSGGSAG